MRADIGGTDMSDGAASLLPPPREQHLDPTDQLWHTASFAAIPSTPAPRRKLTTGLTALGLTTIAVCGFAGVKLAGMAGLTPPSPPRYVIAEQTPSQAATQPPTAPAPEPAPPVPPVAPARPPVMNSSHVSHLVDPAAAPKPQDPRRKHKHGR